MTAMLQRIFPLCSVFNRWTTTGCSQPAACGAEPAAAAGQGSSDRLKQQLIVNKSNVTLFLSNTNEGAVVDSLMLQAAVSCNTEGCRVLFITPLPLNQLPRLVHGMPSPDPVLMKRVKILYIQEMEKLISFLAEVHKTTVLPDVIIIQALDAFMEQGHKTVRVHCMARLLALIASTAQFISSKISTFNHILVSVTDPLGKYQRMSRSLVKDVWTVNIVSDGEYKILQRSTTSLQPSDIVISFRKREGDLLLSEISQSSCAQAVQRCPTHSETNLTL